MKCVDSHGQVSMTNDIAYNSGYHWSVQRIMNECFGLYDKLEWLYPANRPYYAENGIKLRFRFTGLNENPG